MSIYETHKPKDSGIFLKIEDGETVTLRIASDPVIFSAENQDGSVRTGYAWKVWNQTDSVAQILQQSTTFFKNVANLAKNKNWGDPTTYDIDVTREGTGLDTRYNLTAVPNKEPLTKEALTKINEVDIIGKINESRFAFGAMWLSEAENPSKKADEPKPKKPDTVVEYTGDEPISLDDIPF